MAKRRSHRIAHFTVTSACLVLLWAIVGIIPLGCGDDTGDGGGGKSGSGGAGGTSTTVTTSTSGSGCTSSFDCADGVCVCSSGPNDGQTCCDPDKGDCTTEGEDCNDKCRVCT